MRGWGVILLGLGLLGLAACGRIGFDPSGSSDAADSGPATGPWVAVTAGYNHTCAIKDTGETWCWGGNLSGELGVGGPKTYSSAPQVLPGTWTTIAHGAAMSCGIQRDGSLWCWGNGDLGQLGLGSLSEQLAPTRVGTDSDWVEISAGASHACGRRADLSAWCWGDNGMHEYDSAGTNFTSPRMVGSARSISASDQHTLMVRTDGVLMASGPDLYGELGGGAVGLTYSGFAQIGTDVDWAKIATKAGNSCGIKTDGSLWCWGVGDRGALGLGDEAWRSRPVRVGADTDWATLQLSSAESCATKIDGRVFCWGATVRGALGASTDDQLVPQLLAGGPYRAMVAGLHHRCTVDMLGALRCGGVNDQGQIRPPASAVLVPQKVDDGPWTTLAAYRYGLCAIDAATTLWCWGRNRDGELGDGSRRDRETPVQIGGAGWTAIAIGNTLSLGLNNGKLMVWGGSGMRAPVAVTTPFTDWTKITAGESHVCALRATGDLYCWGYNSDGQVGNGTTAYQGAPVLISSGFTDVAAGGSHTCAYQAGAMRCWGRNSFGELGNGSQNSSPFPVGVTCGVCGNGVRALAAGDEFNCTLLTSGALVCWGQNVSGEFGDSAPNPVVTTAVSAAGGTNVWRDVAAGDSHTCAIKLDGTLWCFGHGDGGQLGTNTLAPTNPSPMQVGASNQWKSVTPYNHGTCALQNDGSRWCWGANYDGQYGDDTSWFPDFVVLQPDR